MDDGPSSPTSIDPTSGSRATRPVPTERKPAMPSRPDGNMERRQRRAAPDLRHGALAHVTIGQRLASARHSNRVLTLHPLLCPPSTPPLCNNNHRPTQPNPTQPYPTPLPRTETSSRSTLLCLSISLERMHGGARMHAHTLSSHAHTTPPPPPPPCSARHTSAQEQRTNAERASERAGGRRGGGGGDTKEGDSVHG